VASDCGLGFSQYPNPCRMFRQSIRRLVARGSNSGPPVAGSQFNAGPTVPTQPPLPIPLLKPFAFLDNSSTWADGFSQHGIFELVGVNGIGTPKASCIVRRIATARVDCPLNETRKFWLDGFGKRIKRVDWSSFG